MTSDPEQIRAEVTQFLARVPDPEEPGADVEAIAARLEEAHELLVDALESVERTPRDITAGSETEG
jgi:hypothetical protein